MTAEISRICAPIFRRSNLMWGTDQGQSPSSFKFVNNRVERVDSTALPKSFVICRIRFLSRQHGNEIGKTKILFRFSRSSGSSPKLPFPERFFLLLTIMSQLFFVFPQPRFPSLFSIFFATLRTKREANKKKKTSKLEPSNGNRNNKENVFDGDKKSSFSSTPSNLFLFFLTLLYVHMRQQKETIYDVRITDETQPFDFTAGHMCCFLFAFTQTSK